MSREVICLHHSPVEPYRCVLDTGHDGPHKAFHHQPEQYPGCVWAAKQEADSGV